MKFKKGIDSRRNLKGRPMGSKNRRNIIVDALQEVYGENGEQLFWVEVAKTAMQGDSPAMGLIANRLVPALKAERQYLQIDLSECNGATAAQILIEATTRGELSPDQLNSLVSSISVALKIEEATTLEERVATLENSR